MNRTLTLWRAFVLALGLIIAPAILSGPLQAQTAVFINEIHYDDANGSGDINESVEIAGPAGTSLSDYQIILYNGANGLVYNTRTLSGVIPDEGGGYGTMCFTYPTNGIQNGSPDGVALFYNPQTGTPGVIQFLSYEGSFTAVDGPAIGVGSFDILLSETNSTPIGFSLQLSGFGSDYEDFIWEGPIAATCGSINTNQVMATSITFCAEVLSFDLPGQTGPAVIDTVNNTITVEVFGGTNLAALVPSFTLCLYATAIDPLSQNVIISGSSVVNFSDTVVWDIIGEVPVPETYEIIVTVAATQAPKLVINEVDYDNPDLDNAEFIELKNVGTVAANLENMMVKLINGNGAVVYRTITLPDTVLQPGHYYVICGNPANTPECDLDYTVNTDVIQNGAPDGIALYDASNLLLDVLSYEGDIPGYVETTGVGLEDLSFLAPYGLLFDAGLSRYPDGTDTDHNFNDFLFTCTTPGAPNGNSAMPCRCMITSVTLDTSTACAAPQNTYTATITVTHYASAGLGDLVVSSGNGSYYGTFPIISNPQTLVLTGLSSNGLDLDLEVYLSGNMSCIWSTDSLLTAPVPCVNCIDSAWVSEIGTCDPATNTYFVTFNWWRNYAISGLWVVQAGNVVDTIPFTPQKAANHGYGDIEGLIADGQPVDITIYNLSNPGCVATFHDLWIAPQNCFEQPELVINEVDYDQVGADAAEFIEIRNNGQDDIHLEGYSIKLINGSNNGVYATYTFLEGMYIMEDGYFVICANAANTANCDWDVSPDADMVQNGAPDALALYDPFGGIIDMLSYEGNVTGYTEGSGVGLNDVANTTGHGLSRYPDGVDTDVNNVDFTFKCITPGEANTYLSGYCGPFHTGTLNVYYGNAMGPINMPNVVVTAKKGGVVMDEQVTDMNGMVVFDSLQNGSYTFVIDPETYNWGWGGVNALDALLIAKTFAGLWTLNGIYLWAGNVNGVDNLNVTDAQLVAQRFAGLIQSFPVGDWMPLSWGYNLSWTEDHAFQEYFPLLCFGDVNGSYEPLVPVPGPTKSTTMGLMNEGVLVAADEVLRIPVSLDIPAQPGALSLVMGLPGNLSLQGITMMDGTQPLYTLEEGVLTLAWFSLEGRMLEQGAPLMYFDARVEGSLEAPAFTLLEGSEFAEATGEKRTGFNLLMPSVAEAVASVHIYPNPATSNARLNFSVPVDGEVTIGVYNVVGNQVMSLPSSYMKTGNHELALSLDGLAEGTYFVKMQAGEFSALDRLVVVR